MFIEYCFFLFALHTCKFCKIASINFVVVVYTKKKNLEEHCLKRRHH